VKKLLLKMVLIVIYPYTLHGLELIIEGKHSLVLPVAFLHFHPSRYILNLQMDYIKFSILPFLQTFLDEDTSSLLGWESVQIVYLN
jgi:hypothetical protein